MFSRNEQNKNYKAKWPRRTSASVGHSVNIQLMVVGDARDVDEENAQFSEADLEPEYTRKGEESDEDGDREMEDDSESDDDSLTDDDSETEASVDDEERNHCWSEDQLELLQSALASYQFLPRTTTEKVYTELREESNCTRGMVKNWFSTQERVAMSARDRWKARLKKLASCDHAQGSQTKVNRRVKFFEEIAVREVNEC